MLEIKTKKSRYIFDNSSGYIIPVSDELERGLENFIGNDTERTELIAKYLRYNLFKEYVTDEVEESGWDALDVENEITKSYFMNLQLVLTGNCNFRCEYCMYSDKYPGHVDFSDTYMSLETAKKAVDMFAETIRKKNDLGITGTPSISFYGGEPLLAFDMIKDVVAYAQKKIEGITFAITTNASLLSDSAIEFLLKNEFVIAISLDGYKENHDRNRKLFNGNTSYDLVWEKIKRIRSKEQGQSAQLLFLCCIDQYTDLLQLADFFFENYDMLWPCSIRINAINQLDTTYYEYCNSKYENSNVFKKQDQNHSLNILRERLEKKYYGDKTKDILIPFFASEISVLIGSRGTKRLRINNSCLPGSKLTVLPNGDIAPCEKTGTDYIIGNVVNGLDYNEIILITERFSALMDKCTEKRCPIRRVCSACLAFAKKPDVMKDGFCELEMKSKKALLKIVCENLEKNSGYYDELLLNGEKLEL